MPKADWDGVPDAGTFDPIPAGEYAVECTGVTEKTGRDSGLPYYNIELTVRSGEFDGRKVWDSIAFEGSDDKKTKYALQRVKLVAHRLGGVHLTGNMEFDPHSLMGRQWYASVIVDVRGGQERNAIPFAGYKEREDDPEEKRTIEPKDDLPF